MQVTRKGVSATIWRSRPAAFLPPPRPRLPIFHRPHAYRRYTIGQSKHESGAGAFNQFEGAAFARTGRRSKRSQFNQRWSRDTSSAVPTHARKPALETIVAEPQSRCSTTQPMDARQVGGRPPKLIGNALARDASGSPSFQALGQRLELWGFVPGSRRCRCHSSPPTLAGTGGGVTHACRSDTMLRAFKLQGR